VANPSPPIFLKTHTKDQDSKRYPKNIMIKDIRKSEILDAPLEEGIKKYSRKECQVCFTHPKIHQLCKNFHSLLSIKRSLFNSIQPVFIHSVQLIERMNRILYAHTYKCRYKILKSLSYSKKECV